MKKKNQKIKLSFADIKQLIVIANSLDNSHPNIADFIDDFLIEGQDQEDLLAALKNEVSEEEAIEIINISKNI